MRPSPEPLKTTPRPSQTNRDETRLDTGENREKEGATRYSSIKAVKADDARKTTRLPGGRFLSQILRWIRRLSRNVAEPRFHFFEHPLAICVVALCFHPSGFKPAGSEFIRNSINQVVAPQVAYIFE